MSRNRSSATLSRSTRALLVVLLVTSSSSLAAQQLHSTECAAGPGRALSLVQPAGDAGALTAVDLARVSTRATPSFAAERTAVRPAHDRRPSVAGTQAEDVVVAGATCFYSPKNWIQGSWCGQCGFSWPCFRKTVYYYQQDCWVCTDPSLNWCNDPFLWDTQCFDCSCL